MSKRLTSYLYVAVIANELTLHQWFDVEAQELQPLIIHTNLPHMDIPGRNSLIAAFNSLVLKFQGSSYMETESIG